MEPGRGEIFSSRQRRGPTVSGDEKSHIFGSSVLPYMYHSNNPGTKAGIPRVTTTSHVGSYSSVQSFPSQHFNTSTFKATDSESNMGNPGLAPRAKPRPYHYFVWSGILV